MSEDFSGLGLSAKVLEAVVAAGYTRPTEIQAKAIPYVLEHKDIIGIAQTGTGKTASFVLPMLTLLEQGRARARMPRTLILEPTRELAAQVHENFEKYGINYKLNVALLIGGVSVDDQIKKLDRGVDVLIATPGRLLDLYERGRILLTGVDILVVDEADRMLDMGFIPDVERICTLLPPRRQTLFFSATMASEIQKLTSRFLRDPIRIEVAPQQRTAENIDQWLLRCGGKPIEKRAALRAQINAAEALTNAIVFCNRKREVATLQRSLERHGFNAGALHGDMDQKSRTETLDRFRAGGLTLLVASDVAARGLDIPAVSHIFNFDVPTHPEDYIHRIGRTGRAGRSGVAITLVAREDIKHIDAIIRLVRRDIPYMDAPTPVPDELEAEESQDAGRRRQRGRSGDSRRSGGRSGAERKPSRSAEERPAPVRQDAPRPAREETSRPVREEAPRPARAAESPQAPQAPKARKERRPEKAPPKREEPSGPFDTGPVPAFLLRPTGRSN